MKHKKTIGGLILLASLALAGCNVSDRDSTDPSATGSDSSTTSVVPSDDTSSEGSPSDGGASSAPSVEADPETGRALRTVADLELLREFPADEFHLMNDIDLSGTDWVPIPSFSGTFNGRNNKLVGLTIEEVALYDAGFFVELAGAIINDLTFANPTLQILVDDDYDLDEALSIGVLAARIGRDGEGDATVLTNVNVAKTDDGIFSAHISIVGATEEQSEEILAHVGGLVGISDNDLSISDSDVFINMMGPIKFGGGVVALVNNSTVDVSNVTTAGESIVEGNVGGVVGMLNESPATFIDVHNNMELSTGSGVLGGIVAGIVGSDSVVAISDSSHGGHLGMIATGAFDAVEAVGGIVGVIFEQASLDLTNVRFKSTATFSGRNDNLGGLVGVISEAEVIINRSFVEQGAHLVGHNVVGGFVASVTGANLTISDSYVAADLSGKIMMGGQFSGGHIGGFVARADDTLVIISDAFFAGNVVSAQSQAALLFGTTTGSNVVLNRVVAHGTVTANMYVSNLIGMPFGTTTILNEVYYDVKLFTTDGEPNADPNVLLTFQGTEIAPADIDNAFFATTLVWDSDVWNFTASDFVNGVYPTLK